MAKRKEGLTPHQVRQRQRQQKRISLSHGMTRKQIKDSRRRTEAERVGKNPAKGCAVVGLSLVGAALTAARFLGRV